ncbi:MAG: LysR family transcriptional regulator [Hyphomicrobiales bacterium]|nr:LysR family transcriptional regulator [Hyphomicrobiales bacterium]MDE2114138.1 LysR family transcriptional regulator [Hyphomicrobiales bacterium]
MILEQLRIFVAVAERLHVTQAARALNMAQSAVSASLANLERRYQTRLFHRVGRGIELNEAGRMLLPEARELLARVDQTEAMLAELVGLRRGTLLVQASQTIASYWLPRHLVAFRAMRPEVEISLGVGNSADVVQCVLNGAASIGFIEGEAHHPSLSQKVVARDQLMLVVAPNHRLAQKPTLDPAELIEETFVMREKGSGTRSVLEAALQGFGLALENLQIGFELPSNEAVRAAVEAGAGIAAISASVVAGSLETGLLQALPIKLPERRYQALWHKERGLNPAAQDFLKVVQSRA